jgi:hypothetical protein
MTPERKRIARLAPALLLLLALSASSTGCAVMMAASQPPKRDVSVFLPGTPRPFVIAEVGTPVESERVDGVLTDSFVFQQGYSKEVRALRAMVHGAADIATGGAWEFVGTPFEAIVDGHTVRLQVRYDGMMRIVSTDVYEGDKVMRHLYEEAGGGIVSGRIGSAKTQVSTPAETRPEPVALGSAPGAPEAPPAAGHEL